MRWFGHVYTRVEGYTGRGVLKMELPGKRRRGRPKRRFVDLVREDMQPGGCSDHGRHRVQKQIETDDLLWQLRWELAKKKTFIMRQHLGFCHFEVDE